MIHDCNGEMLDGLILVDENDAVSRVSVEMPPGGWKEQQFAIPPFQPLPHAPLGAGTPTLQSVNKLNDSSFCQYRWRFKIPSVVDMMVKPEIEFVAWVKFGSSTFKVTPATNDVDSLKKAVKAEIEANFQTKVNAITLTVKDKDGKVLKASSPLTANTEETAYVVE